MSLPLFPKLLRHRVIAAGLVCGLATLSAGYVDRQAQTMLSNTLDKEVVLLSAVKNHTNIDMYHDGLRAIVLSALTANDLGTSKDEVEVELAEMSADFRRLVAANKALPLSDDVRAALEGVGQPLEAYLRAGSDIVLTAFADRQSALAKMPEFNTRFEELETSLGDVGDLIEAKAKENAELASGVSATSGFLLLAAYLGILASMGVLMTFVLAGVMGPIGLIEKAMMKLAGGYRDVIVPFVDRQNEVGSMARALEVFAANIAENETMRAERAAADLRAAEQRKVDLARLADSFQETVGKIIGSVTSSASGLEEAAKTLSRSADATRQLSGMVAEASQETSAGVQGVASATEQLALSVREISQQVHDSSTIANSAVEMADVTNRRVAELLSSAERIGNVVSLINSIASQTNLLALNATIEAARAGEAGKGFAVVAQEVKALAEQTAKATNEIGTQITGMQAATQDAVASIAEVTGTIAKISAITGAITSAVEEQTSATSVIGDNVKSAANGTSEVSSNIADVSFSANETGKASAAVLGAAQALSSEGAALRVEVERFLSTVRAA